LFHVFLTGPHDISHDMKSHLRSSVVDTKKLSELLCILGLGREMWSVLLRICWIVRLLLMKGLSWGRGSNGRDRMDRD
jgi:hypothetical protein